MRKLLPGWVRGFLCLYLLGSSFLMHAGTPLSGAYTINSANPASSLNFTSFQMAADSLTTNGVSGAVTITVSAGTHSGYMNLGGIAGASSTNTITFDGGDTSTTTLSNDGAVQNATITLDSAEWVTITNMKIINTKAAGPAFGVKVTNNANWATISNCAIEMATVTSFSDIIGVSANGSLTSGSSEGIFGDNLTISNNVINNGYYGIRLETSSANDSGATISSNWLHGNLGYGFYADNLVAFSLTGNTVDGASLSSKDGFYMTDVVDFNIQNNKTEVPDYGMYLADGNFDGVPSTTSSIINNMFGSTGDEGAYFDDVEMVNVYHNTFKGSGSTSAYGIRVNDLNTVSFKNNIFFSESSYAFYSVDDLTTVTGLTLDYNAYYSGGTSLAYSSSSNIYADLAAWQTADAINNVNSVEGDPLFVSDNDLHVIGTVANDVGDNSLAITTDIDGDTRPLTPSTIVDMGADEFAAATCFPPTALGAFNITDTSAVIHWITGGASNWNLEIGLSGFAQGTGFMAGVVDDTVALSSLVGASSYDFYVQDTCGLGDISSWTGPYTFRTLCTVQSLPYSENFDANSGCFTAIDGGGATGDGWAQTVNGSQNLDGTGYIRVDSDAAGSGVHLIETAESPIIDASVVNNSLILEFDHYFRSGDSASVLVYDGASWITVAVYQNNTGAWSGPSHEEIDVTAYANANFQVRFLYDDGNAWAWYWAIDNFSIADKCLPQSLPFIENFDATAGCMEVNDLGTGAGDSWVQTIDATSNLDGTGYMFVNSDADGNGVHLIEEMETPAIDASGVTGSLLLDFDQYYRDVAANDSGYVDVYDGTSWVNVAVYGSSIGGFGAPDHQTIDITAYANATLKVRFAYNDGNTWAWYWAVDNISIAEVGCLEPSALGAFNITDTSAVIHWITGGASNWNLEIGTTGFAPGTGFMAGVVDDTVALSGLVAGTSYDFYVQDTCGLGDVSNWVGPYTFMTPCAIQSLPYSENFDADAGCFTAIDGGGATGDSWVQTVNAGQNLDGTGYMRVDSDANGNGVHLIETAESPIIDASVVNNSLILEFDHYFRSGDSASVLVYDGASWITVAVYQNNTGAWSGPSHEEIDVTAYANANFQVRFLYNDGNAWAWYWAIDNFAIADKCPKQSLPYAENFDIDQGCVSSIDGGAALGDSWVQTINAGQNLDGTGYMFVNSDANGNGVEMIEAMETPAIDASSLSGGNLLLDFDQYYRDVAANDSGYVDVYDGANWVNVAVYGSSIGGFGAPDHQTIDITAYANADLKVRFTYNDGNTWAWYWAVDNISIAEVGCLTPSALGAFNETTTSADVYWTPGNASNWNIEYGVTGFTPGTGTIVSSTNDTTTLSSLMSSTTYDFYVQDSCALGDVSSWVGPTSFTTLCDVFNTFPWVENFDVTTNTIPLCWENEINDNSDWLFRNGSIGHGSTGDNTTGSGYYAGVDDSHGNGNDTVNNLLTPVFDLTSLTAPRLNFFYYIGNDNVLTSTLYIDVYDGTTWNAAVATINHTSSAWLQSFLDLTAYKSIGTQIRFRVHETTDFNSDISIDDITIEETPSCQAATALGSFNETTMSAEVYWTTGGAANSNIEYGVAGFTPGTGTILMVTNDTATISGLMPSTMYDFYVQDSCGMGDVSAWTGPQSFITLCAPFTAPVTESFDGTTIPLCWSQYSTIGNWSFTGTTNSTQCAAAADNTGNSGGFAWMDQSSTDDSVVMEMNDVDVSALTTPYLEFYYWMCGLGYTPINLTIIETWDGAAWTLLDTLDQATAGWESFGYDLTGHTYGSNLVRVRFRAESGGSGSDFIGDNALDDISIMEMPACPVPSALGAISITDTSAVIHWTTGGAINWNIEIGPTGFAPGTGFMAGVLNDSIGLSGLVAGTSYDFYVQDSCGLGDISSWVGPFTFVTSVVCPAIEALPFFEDFNISEGCFDTIDGGAATGDSWLHTVNAGQNLDGTGYMFVNSDANGNGTLLVETLESPIIDASVVNNSLILEFDHYYRDVAGADSGTVQVYDGANWVNVITYNNDVGAFGAPAHEVLDVTAYANANFQVRFFYDDANVWAWYWAVDNFSVADKCVKQSLPYAENFDIDQACFTSVDGGAAIGDSWLHTVNAGQNLDGTGYMFVNSDANGNGIEMIEDLLSPTIDASGITGTLMLEFDQYYRDVAGADSGSVDIYDGANWVTIAVFNSDLGAFGAPDHQAIDISAYANADLQVRFNYNDGNTWAWYWAIDNFSVMEVGCVAPSGLGTDMATTTQTSADIYWTSGGAANWNVEYGPIGFTPGTGTLIAATNDTISVTGLMASLCYDFYVQDSCGLGDVSTFTGPFTFCTLCGPFVAPYTENFDGITTPNCWTEYSVSGGPWLYSTGLNSVNCPGAPDHTGNGGNYAWMDQSGTDTLVSLEMNEVDVSGLTTPYLEFFYWMCGSGYTPINLTILETWDGAAWTLLDTMKQSTSGWELQGYDLTGHTYGAGMVKVRFTAESGRSGSDFFGDNGIDDVSIIEKPACLDPTNLAVVGQTTTTIDLTWNSDTNIISSRIEYGPVGFTLGTGVSVATAPGSLTVLGLTPGTCYEFYVQDSCTAVTAWLGPILGCTGSVCSVTTTPTVTGDSALCGGSPITLTGTPGSGDIAWMLNGTVLGTGNSYTDSIGGTTVYSAADYSVVAPAVHVGPLSSIAAAGFGNFTNGQWFTVMDTISIDSTTVRANGFVEASVVIFDDAGGNIVQIGDTFTTGTLTADYQVPVNVILTPGNYFMGVDFHAATTGQLFRATSGAVYPYLIPGLMSIDSVNFAGARYYYTFDLIVSGACLGTSVPVVGFVPGPNSGSSDTVNVCETESMVDLASFLGTHDAGGTWVDLDATAALVDSIFDATLVDTNSYYSFNYVLPPSGGCVFGDTSTITVFVDFLGNPGMDASDTLCTDNNSLLSLNAYLGTHNGGGAWSDVDSSGALLGNRVRPSNGAPGTYRFEYTIASNGACPSVSSIVTITLEDPVSAGANASDTLCDSIGVVDLSSYLDTTASAGGIWVDADGSGGLSGSMLTTASVTANATYNFVYRVSSAGCGNDSATVTIYVDDCVVGLAEQRALLLDVYPNPTSGIFFIETKGLASKGMSVEVYSINGQLLLTDAFEGYNSKVALDLSEFAKGVYNVKIRTENGSEVHRITRQ